MPLHLLTADWTHHSFAAKCFRLHRKPPVFVPLILHESSADFLPIHRFPEPLFCPTPDKPDIFSRSVEENPVKSSLVPVR